jgi:galactose mutarotase-like enzyme
VTGPGLTVGEGPLRVVVDSARGGRLTSLTCDGREWLAPTGARDLERTPGSATPFVRPGMGGWDEVIPTVAATGLPDGRRLGDHGEAWWRPWTIEASSVEALTMSVRLTSLPLTLRRTVQVTGRTLRLSYTVEVDTTAVGPTPVLWSAHPQFDAPGGTRLVLGRGPTTARVEYPAGRGALVLDDRDVLAELPAGTALKAFVDPGTAVDTAGLVHADGAALTLRWDARAVPYLGLWWDNGCCASTPVIAVEPCTGFGDDAAEALARGMILSLPPGARHRWWVQVEVSPAPVRTAGPLAGARAGAR